MSRSSSRSRATCGSGEGPAAGGVVVVVVVVVVMGGVRYAGLGEGHSSNAVCSKQGQASSKDA